MNQFKFFSLTVLLFAALNLSAGEIKTRMPAALKVENKNLVLNGTGVRNKFCLDLYVGALYLENKTCNASDIVNSDQMMAIKIQVISDLITSKRLEEGMRSEFSRVTNGNIQPYKDRIEKLVQAFRQDVKTGDVFDLVYIPEKGLSIYKNGTFQTNVEGLDFKRILFSTWLGEDPADNNMKKGMIGI